MSEVGERWIPCLFDWLDVIYSIACPMAVTRTESARELSNSSVSILLNVQGSKRLVWVHKQKSTQKKDYGSKFNRILKQAKQEQAAGLNGTLRESH